MGSENASQKFVWLIWLIQYNLFTRFFMSYFQNCPYDIDGGEPPPPLQIESIYLLKNKIHKPIFLWRQFSPKSQKFLRSI